METCQGGADAPTSSPTSQGANVVPVRARSPPRRPLASQVQGEARSAVFTNMAGLPGELAVVSPGLLPHCPPPHSTGEHDAAGENKTRGKPDLLPRAAQHGARGDGACAPGGRSGASPGWRTPRQLRLSELRRPWVGFKTNQQHAAPGGQGADWGSRQTQGHQRGWWWWPEGPAAVPRGRGRRTAFAAARRPRSHGKCRAGGAQEAPQR